MNPYPKPAPGSYREPIIAGFDALGQPTAAEMFRSGKIKLGIVASFTGQVQTQTQLVDGCITALKAVPQTDVTRYYIYQLENNLAVPACSDGAYVYNENDAKAVAYVKERLKQDAARVYAPGELYMRS